MQRGNSTSDTWTGFWLFAFLLAVYLVNYHGQIHAADEVSLLVVGKSLRARGSFDASAQIWAQQVELTAPQEGFGADGQLYSKKGPGQPLALAPLMALGYADWPVSPAQLAFLLNPIVTALSAIVVFACVRCLTRARSTALLGALSFGLATPALPYTKYLFNEPLTGLCFGLALFGLLWWHKSDRAAGLCLTASALAAAAAVRQEVVALIPLFGGYVLFAWFKRSPRHAMDLFVFGAPLVLGIGALALYNLNTVGSIFPTLYQLGTSAESFSTPLLYGLYGLFVSPGKGLLFYAPILVFVVPGALRLWPRQRHIVCLLVGALMVYASLHAMFRDWWGGTAWGPRSLVPLLPLLAIVAALGIERAAQSRIGRLLLVGAMALSLAAQLLGTTVNFLEYAAVLSRIRPDAEWTIGVNNWYDSPILGHARLLAQAVPDVAWATPTDGGWTVDWALLMPLAALLIGMAWALWRTATRATRSLRWALGASIACVLCMAWLVARAYDHVAIDDAQAWRDVSAVIHAHGRADDVLVTTAPGGQYGLLYYDKSPLRWYHFVEEPTPLRPRTQDYLERYVGDTARVWLAAWKTTETNPDIGFDAWFAARTYQVAQWDFGKPARLALFERPRNALGDERNVSLGGIVTLQRAQIERREIAADSPLCFRLTWRVVQPTNETIIAFAHLVDAGGRVRAQIDRAPLNGSRPAASWKPGDVFDDHVVVPPGDDLSAGTYQLVAGMYRWPSLERLRVAGAPDNLIALGAVNVTAAARAATPSCYSALN